MAQRPIELPWLRQPTEQAGINWSNPLTRGLVRLVAWRGIEAVDLVTGAALNRVSTGFAAAVLSDGEGSSNTNESSYWELPITTEARNSLSMGWVGLHSGGSVPITVRDSSSSFGTILFWRNGGGWQTRAGGTGGSVDIAAAGAFAIGRIYAACTSIGASTARVHVDGAQVTSGSTSGSSGTLLSPWVLHHNGAISGAALASSLLLAVWDRDLTATEAQSFTGRPWQLFKDQIIWVPVSAGGSDATIAGATTSATASLIAGSLTAGSAIAGQTLAAAASLLPGQLVAGAQLAGQTLAASASLVPGDLRAGSTIAGTTLAAGASLLPGSLIGQGDATISGATLSAAATLIPGALSSSGNAQTIAGATMSVTSSIIVGNLLAGATLPGQVVGASAILVPGVLFDASAAGGLRQARLHVGIGLRI